MTKQNVLALRVRRNAINNTLNVVSQCKKITGHTLLGLLFDSSASFKSP